MAALKDTILVAVFCVLLHPLQVLLVALEAPGVVLELRASSIAPLQTVVEHLSLLDPLLLAFHTGTVKTEVGQPDRQIRANLLDQTTCLDELNMFFRDLNKHPKTQNTQISFKQHLNDFSMLLQAYFGCSGS